MIRTKFLALAATALLWTAHAHACNEPAAQPLKGTVQATVQYVDDGDTLEAIVAGVCHRIRFSDIDAPETTKCKGGSACARPGQQFSQAATDFTRRLAPAGSVVTLKCTDYDSRFGRSVCRVIANGRDVNAELVAAGLAWFNEKYSNDNALRVAERQAQQRRLGLWAQPQPVAPWIWRDACWRGRNCPAAVY